MRLVICDTVDYVAEWSAKYVLKRINDFNPNKDKYFVLGLPTGTLILIFKHCKHLFNCIANLYIIFINSFLLIWIILWIFSSFFSYYVGGTPLGMYKKLISYYQQGKISFKYVKTFNMDEYVDLPRDHPESYHYYMYNNFFKHMDIDPENVHILDGNAADLEKECDDFERKIKEAGGIELFIGGT